MRFVAAFTAAFVAMVLVYGGPHAQTSATQVNQPWLRTPNLVDPIFGIVYDPVLVRFEPEPERLSRCAPIGDPPGQLFVFARIVRNGTEYVWLDGWLRNVPDGPDTGPIVFEADPSGGWIVIVRGGQCKTTGAMGNYTKDQQDHAIGRAAGITDDIAAALLRDAIKREVQAFGGRIPLLKRIDADDPRAALKGKCTAPISDGYPLIQTEMARLRCPTQDR